MLVGMLNLLEGMLGVAEQYWIRIRYGLLGTYRLYLGGVRVGPGLVGLPMAAEKESASVEVDRYSTR